jgi:hypothetical protein
MDSGTKQQKVRLNLELPQPVRENLARLQDETHSSSVAEVIRRALALFDLAVEHTKEGGDVVLRRKDGTEKTIHLV